MLLKNGKKGTVRGQSKNKNTFSRGGVVSVGNFEDTKMRVTIDTSKIHDKNQKYESGKKLRKKGIKKGRKSPNF